MAGGAAREKQATVAGLPRTTDGELAAAKAFASLDYGEGPRIGCLGDSRCGKTEACRRLIAHYLRRSPGAVFVIDNKPGRNFVGQERRDPQDLIDRVPDPEPRVIVFKGATFATQGVDPEEIARLQWSFAQRRRPSLVCYDELGAAATAGQWKAGPRSMIGWAFGKGGGVGAGSLWGDQETEAVPREPFNQSTHILCFRLSGNPLRLLKQRNYCEGGVDQVIPRLPGTELPPAERGYFVLLERGRPWDGHVYRFGAAG